MSVTLEDFYIRVLRELGVVEPNGRVSSEDRQRVVEIYPNIHAELLTMGLAQWAVTEAIPAKFVEPMVRIVAFPLTSVFSVSPEKLLMLKQEGELNAIPQSAQEVKLRKLISAEYISEPIKNEFN